VIQWPVPSDIYLDTGIILGAMFPGTPDSTSCGRFCNDLANADSRVYTAQIARMDLARALRQTATKPGRLPADIRTSFNRDLWATNPLIRSRWLWHGVREFDRLVGRFAFFIELPFTMDLWRRSLDLMAAETLDSSDGMHLATARSASLEYFATTDSDFRRVQSPHVLLIRDTPNDLS
jgi:predicted nucleic acid-binding protein